MNNEQASSQTTLPDTSKSETPLGLPRGSLWHLETALTYARMARKSGSDIQKDEFLGVVIEQLEEIKKKGEKGK